MPGIHATTTPIISRDKPYPPDGKAAADVVEKWGLPNSNIVGQGLRNISASLQQIHAAARQNPPEITKFVVTDGITGRVIAALGQYEVRGIVTSGGYFSELYAGDPYGNSDPAYAILSVTPDGKVQIGQNGWVDVLDPYGADAAWIGTQNDTLPVTGAGNNGGGLIRLTVTAHTLSTGDTVQVLRVGGVPNATGIFTVTSVDANHIDLQNSVWDGAYTSGGTVDRLLHVTAVTNNGSGLFRIQTAVAHGYESGDRVNLAGCGSANGQWTITVFDSTHFDLNGSAFTSGSNGTCLRYFAGGNFQTVAVGGTGFADYKLRAFADGSLKIKDATITLVGNGITVTLNDANFPGDTTTDSVGFWLHDDTNGQDVFISKLGFFVRSADDIHYPIAVFMSSGPGAEQGNITLSNAANGWVLELKTGGAGSPQLIAADGSNTGNYRATGVRLTDSGSDVATLGPTSLSVTNGAQTSSVSPTNVDSPGFSASGTPGVGLSKTFVLNVVPTFANAVTSVSGTGVSFSTGLFVQSIALTTEAHSWTKGLLTT